MDNKLQIILNIVKEYFKIMDDIFVKSDQVVESQVVLILIHSK